VPEELFGGVELSVLEFENAAAEVASKTEINNALGAG
jgi:hypothetical protein